MSAPGEPRDDATTPADKPDRSDREYPHGSGDRNTVPPLKPDELNTFEGGTQRDPEPVPPGSGDGPDAGKG